jgi:hypothetical protein
MRRTGHIRDRSPGSFELRYSLGADPATGRRKIATVTVRGTRKEAEKEMRRLLRAIDTGEHVDPNRLTVREWLKTWLDVIRQEVAPRTAERYGEIVNNRLAPALGNLPLTKLAPVHLQNAYNGWADGGRRDGKAGGLSPRTRRHIHRILERRSRPRRRATAHRAQPMRRVQKAAPEGRAPRNGNAHGRAIGAAARCGAAFAYLLAGTDRARHRRKAR